MKISDRATRISISKTLAVAESALKLKDQGLDVVDFGPGEPDFDTPANISQAGVRAIEAGFTRYTPAAGIKELRSAIVESHRRDFGSSYDITECMANVGGKGGIFNAFAAVVDEGDDVIIPTPYWVSFSDIARFTGANPVFLDTQESEGFQLTASMVERAITARTRLLVVNSPNNPSGAVLDPEEFVRIARVCAARGVYMLSDECYSKFLYDGVTPYSIGSEKDTKSVVIISGSLSKTYAMTGWRIGFTLAPKEVIQAALKIQSHSITNPTSIAQHAAIEALTGPQDSVAAMLAEYSRRRRYVLDRLKQIPNLRCGEPGGAFYVYPNVASTFGHGIRDSVDFAVRLLEEERVAVVPGDAFGTRDHIRISYATSMEQIDKGLTRLGQFMGRFA